MGETDYEVDMENSVVFSKFKSSAAAASERGQSRNSAVVSKSTRHGDNTHGTSHCHVCRFCSKVFSSGKALGGHVRIHGAGRSNGQSSSRGNVSRGDCSSTDIWVKKAKVPTSRSNGNFNWVRAETTQGEKEEEEEENYNAVKNTSMDVGQEELSDYKMVSLRTLRRNPKRSRRLTDKDFYMELTANNTIACGQCRKEYCSSTSLFDHMRCHPEWNSRRIRPPNDDTNSTDDDSQYNTTGGDIVAHAAADPSSGLSSDSRQSFKGSKDPKEKEEEAASDNESDRESMKSMKVAHQPDSCSLLTWSVTAKRGSKRPIRSTPAHQREEEESEVDNSKELENETETAHFLVMLASGAANTNDKYKVNRPVEIQLTEDSANHSKTKKFESQGSSEDLEAGGDDLGWEEKMKKRTDTTSRPADLGAIHRKVKGCFAITNVNEEGSSESMIEYYMDSSPARKEEEKRGNLSHLIQELDLEPAIAFKKGERHQCCMCHKMFPSDQSLGGHTRCHWTAEELPQTQASTVISIERQLKLLQGQSRNVREPLYDLNQPPPVVEEDLEGAYSMV